MPYWIFLLNLKKNFKKMKKIIVFIALGLFSCSENEETAQSSARPTPKVDVFELQPEQVARIIDVPGSVIPSEEIMLYTEVNGRVDKILFKEGQKVSKGQTLVLVDTDILKAQRKQLLVDLSLAQKDEKRKKELLKGKAISAEEYEKSSATLASIEAQIGLIDTQISKATLKAPFSGTIGLRQISEGAVITSSTPIAKLIQTNPVKIEFSIAEMYASLVETGKEISFNREKDSTRYTAQVYAFEPSIDEGTRMLKIRALMPNTKNIFPGSFVQVRLDLGEENNAFMVPAESIIPILKGQKVYVIREGKVAEIIVQTGIRTADKVQIKGDIKSGDKLLISGLLAVRAGMPVEIKSTSK